MRTPEKYTIIDNCICKNKPASMVSFLEKSCYGPLYKGEVQGI